MDDWQRLHGEFRWHVPERFNVAEVCSARWAALDAGRVAIRHETQAGARRDFTYGELESASRRIARGLRAAGVVPGDRVAIVMPQRFETAVAYMAVLRLGAVAMPLSILFGPEALEYRLNDAGARVALVDENGIDALLAVRDRCPALETVVAAGAAEGRGDADWSGWLAAGEGSVGVADTRADDPAFLIYTSGTTGPPKGALIAQRGLIGNLPGFVCSQNWFPYGLSPGRPETAHPPRGSTGAKHRSGGSVSDAVFWSPADWAWTGGLMDALLPTLYFGREIVAWQARFDAEAALDLMARHRVTHTFCFPTALKAMMKAVPEPRRRFDLKLRAVMSAGEPVGDTVFAWCRDALGVVPNEMFGQTEINYIVGNCAPRWPARPGSMGRAYPGHRVAVIDDDGRECPRGTPGDVALHRLDVQGDPDPVFFLGYWKRDDATRDKFTGDPRSSWCRTGDVATMDADGYLWYQGRSDDVFKAAGYRIGPSEVENCLVGHAAVANAAVVPKPDAARGALVKAYVVLAAGFAASTALQRELQAHVRGRLAPYEYPKEIEFIDALPMTTTGKVQRRVLRLREEERAKAADRIT